MVAVQKKTKAVARQQRVAMQFAKWISDNPNAPLRKKVRKLDQISDIEFLSETYERESKSRTDN